MSKLSKEIMEDIVHRAHEGKEYRSWTYRVLHGVQKYFTFITDDIVQSGVGLAGGGACSVMGSCGAFSGALMALGAKLIPRSDTLLEKKLQQLSYARSKFSQFRDWFVSEFGAITCRDVQFNVFGRVYDVADDEELQKMGEYQKELGKTCSEIAMKSAIKVADMLSQEES